MPFTLAHPAIVLPLKKLHFRLSLTALMAGSMVPDFEFFLQMREVENIGHKWYGVFLFDFPLALIFCYLFHNLLKLPLVSNLPSYFRNRFLPMIGFNWNRYAANHPFWLILSLFTGIASHLLWDGFTHYDGLFVEWVPVLKQPAAIGPVKVPVYFILQVLFSLLGLGVMARAVHSLPVQLPETTTTVQMGYWPLYCFILSGILMVRLVGWPHYNSFWGVFMAVMGGTCYAWVLVSVIIRFYTFKKVTL